MPIVRDIQNFFLFFYVYLIQDLLQSVYCILKFNMYLRIQGWPWTPYPTASIYQVRDYMPEPPYPEVFLRQDAIL